eukprot:1468550-Prymnesium_polylepis.2
MLDRIVAHSVPIELIPGDVEDGLRKHCVGPWCNVVAEVQTCSAAGGTDPVGERRPERMETRRGEPSGTGTPVAGGRRNGADGVRTHLYTPDGDTAARTETAAEG